MSKDSIMDKHYNENLRCFLRYIYIFGCFSRDDFISKSYGGRTYDDLIKRTKSFFPDTFVKLRKEGKTNIYSCKYSATDSSSNYLADSYRYASIDYNHVNIYIKILSMFTQEEILKKKDIFTFQMSEWEAEHLNDKLQNDILVKLRKEGFLKKDNHGKYKLSTDVFESLTINELQDICNFLEFQKNVAVFEVPYYLLQKRLLLYMRTRADYKAVPKNLFSFDNNHFQNALDNIILHPLLYAIHEKKRISITTSQITDDGIEKITKQDVLPVKIIYDAIYGRMFLVFLDTIYHNSKKHLASKKIHEIVKLDIYEEDMTEIERNKVDEAYKLKQYNWCSAGNHAEPQEVVIRFMFSKQNNEYNYNRLLTEGHNGTVVKIDECMYEYKVQVSDAGEMIPWVRSFGEYALVISGGDAKIDGKIARDWDRAISNYETGFIRKQYKISTVHADVKLDNGQMKYSKYNMEGNIFSEFENKLLDAIIFFTNTKKIISKNEIDTYWNDNNIPLEWYIDAFAKHKKPNSEGLQLFDYDNVTRTWTPVITKGIPVRCSFLELQALKSLLNTDNAELFLTPHTICKLKKVLAGVKEEWTEKDIEVRNCYTNNYLKVNTEQKDILRTLIKAVQCNTAVEVVFNKSKKSVIYPLKIKYDLLSRDFKVCFQDGNQDEIHEVKLVDFSSVSLSSVSKEIETISDKNKEDRIKHVSFDIEAVPHTIERCFRQFSYYDRITTYDKEDNKYTMDIEYNEEDEEKVVSDILAMGDRAIVRAPEKMRKKVLLRIQKAAKNYY